MIVFLDSPEQWDELAALATKAGAIGLDSEFHGVQLKSQSAVGRARIHVWSVALRTKRVSPVGYHFTRNWVLPAEALDHPALRAMLSDSAVLKYTHNLPVDTHAFANHGIALGGGVNTLDMARWAWPGLVNDGYFGLKNLMVKKLRINVVDRFRSVVGYEREERITKIKRSTITTCSCGEERCRRRKGHTKTKTTIEVPYVRVRTVHDDYPLESIVPGHERWERLVEYAAADSGAPLQVAELCAAANSPEWPFGGERPAFDSALSPVIAEMEETGLTIDTDWAATTMAKAEADEAAALKWLRRWVELNGSPEVRVGKKVLTEYCPKLWTSPERLINLMDHFGFPRSPISGVGKVKSGSKSTDNVALEWIGKNHPPARTIITVILRLRKIRAGKKYLKKMRDSGGTVHPTCGPAGQDDNRVGAVTGRLGVKGELEMQQLPKRADKDLYLVRRGIVAPTGKVLVVADYTALEVVMMADIGIRLFDDRQLAESLVPGAPDFHSTNTRRLFGELFGWRIPRDWGGKPCSLEGETVDRIPTTEIKKHPYGSFLRDLSKAILYGIFYGKGVYGFSALDDGKGGMLGEKVAQQLLSGTFEVIPMLPKYQAWVESFVRRTGAIYSVDGRLSDLSQLMSGDDWRQKAAIRKALNFPMQAGAAAVVGDAMIRIHRCDEIRRAGFRMALQVHDEIVMVGPEQNKDVVMQLMVKHMTAATANGVPLRLPLQVSVGAASNYAEAK